MIADSAAHVLAHDLAAMRQIVQAALDVIAEQQRKIDLLARTNLAQRDELRRYIHSATVDGRAVLSGPETTARNPPMP